MNPKYPIVKVGRAREYDLRGIRFGLLTAVKKHPEKSASGLTRWCCKCDCGKRSVVQTAALINGTSKSCGCQGKHNLKGQKFGLLTVTGLSRKSGRGFNLWSCVCDCGNRVAVRSASLKNGNTKSCGCLKINNLRGEKNYQAQRMIAECGFWVPSTDPWSVRATRVMSYARRHNIPLSFKTVGEFSMYLKSIAPKTCPVFGKRLTTGKGQSHKWSPSIDKIIPSKGYVRGNIQVISLFANTMKQNATPAELKQFSKWVMETA